MGWCLVSSFFLLQPQWLRHYPEECFPPGIGLPTPPPLEAGILLRPPGRDFVKDRITFWGCLVAWWNWCSPHLVNHTVILFPLSTWPEMVWDPMFKTHTPTKKACIYTLLLGQVLYPNDISGWYIQRSDKKITYLVYIYICVCVCNVMLCYVILCNVM